MKNAENSSDFAFLVKTRSPNRSLDGPLSSMIIPRQGVVCGQILRREGLDPGGSQYKGEVRNSKFEKLIGLRAGK